MSFQDAVKICFSKYVDFNGRARRSEFWWWVLFTFLLGIVASIIDAILGTRNSSGRAWSRAWPTSRCSCRPWRSAPADCTTPGVGWWLLLWLLCIVGWIFLIIWFCQDSHGDNKYGASPEVRRRRRSGPGPAALALRQPPEPLRPAAEPDGQPPATCRRPATSATQRASAQPRYALPSFNASAGVPQHHRLASKLASPLPAAASGPGFAGSEAVLARARPPASRPRPDRAGRPRPAAGATRGAGSPGRRSARRRRPRARGRRSPAPGASGRPGRRTAPGVPGRRRQPRAGGGGSSARRRPRVATGRRRGRPAPSAACCSAQPEPAVGLTDVARAAAAPRRTPSTRRPRRPAAAPARSRRRRAASPASRAAALKSAGPPSPTGSPATGSASPTPSAPVARSSASARDQRHRALDPGQPGDHVGGVVGEDRVDHEVGDDVPAQPGGAPPGEARRDREHGMHGPSPYAPAGAPASLGLRAWSRCSSSPG